MNNIGARYICKISGQFFAGVITFWTKITPLDR